MIQLEVPIGLSDHIRGDRNAPMILVEYADYDSPECRSAHWHVHAVQEHFGARVAFVFRHFPLPEMHPHALPAAAAAEFAAAHGRFWDMHERILASQEELSVPVLQAIAESLDLPGQDLVAALESSTYTEKVREDLLGGVRSNVTGVPTFFLNGGSSSICSCRSFVSQYPGIAQRGSDPAPGDRVRLARTRGIAPTGHGCFRPRGILRGHIFLLVDP